MVEFLAGNRVLGTSSERAGLTNIQTGCEFHETDTNKDYVWNGSAWVYITP